ncbi:MAG: hypothetical protein HYY21_03330 [Candidatus Tectomicrobia bacterium]|nr:hypothetical protein [Candidatus Tectomicrobia bacterium]
MRFLLYLAAAYLLWIVLAAVFRALVKGGRTPGRISGEELVPCAHCGTYVPRSGVVRRKGRDFCGKECAGRFKG